MIQTCSGLSGPPVPRMVRWFLVGQLRRTLCRSPLRGFLRGSVGVIIPQDAVTAERDVMENYHLLRPRALECSPAGSPVSCYRKEREGKQKHKLRVNEVLEGGRERGEVLITYLRVNYILRARNGLSLSVMVTSSREALPANSLNVFLNFSSQGRR